MANLLIKNVPDELVKEFGESISYNNFILKIKKRNNIINYWTNEEIDDLGKSSTILSNSF